jgi:hypothetical protein
MEKNNLLQDTKMLLETPIDEIYKYNQSIGEL